MNEAERLVYDMGGAQAVVDKFVALVSTAVEWPRMLATIMHHDEWGEYVVEMKGGRPVMVKGRREDVKLTDG